MSVSIREVTGGKELRRFIRLPFRLYQGNRCWIPPLLLDEYLARLAYRPGDFQIEIRNRFGFEGYLRAETPWERAGSTRRGPAPCRPALSPTSPDPGEPCCT